MPWPLSDLQTLGSGGLRACLRLVFRGGEPQAGKRCPTAHLQTLSPRKAETPKRIGPPREGGQSNAAWASM